MNIQTIALKNFRNVGADLQEYRLNSKFTVIIGINGKGKSTLLHAIRVACGAFFLGIPDVKKWHIKQEEIRQKDVGMHLTPQRPVLVEAKGFFPPIQDLITWKREIAEGSNVVTSRESDVGFIRSIGKEKYDLVTKEGRDDVNLPVIAFFGTSRAHGAGRNRQTKTGRQIFKDGYQDWFEMKATTFRYQDWLASYEILKKQKKEYEHTGEAFITAIRTANRYIQEIQLVGGEIWMTVNFDNVVSELLPIQYHSDGLRFYTEMVAELAYRCITLNGYLDANAVKESTGVVMIDELDFLLHPTWQRHVVEDLRNAFPKLQFIVTTHSPFIVQSLKSEELINLDKISDVTPSDLSLDEVVEDIMGVESIYSTENADAEVISSKYLSLLNEEKVDYNSVKEELDELEAKISDPGVRAFLQMKRLKKESE